MAKTSDTEPEPTGWRAVPWDKIAAGFVVSAAFLTVLGAFVFWIRFARADVPVVEALSVLPRESFIFTGTAAFATAAPGLVAIAVASVLVKRNVAPPRHDASELRREIDDLSEVADDEHAERLDAARAQRDSLDDVRPIRLGWAERYRWPVTVSVLFLVVIFSAPAWASVVIVAGFLPALLFVWFPTRTLDLPPWFFLAYSAALAFSLPIANQFDERPKVRPVVVERASGAEVRGKLVVTNAAATTVATGDGRLIVVPAREVRLVRVGELPEQPVVRRFLTRLL